MSFGKMRVAVAATVLIVVVILSAQVVIGQRKSDRAHVPPTEAPPSFVPKDGFVPDEATAVKVAEAILVPIYGEREIAGERPFRATLNGDTWTVIGTLPPHVVGGTAVVKLSKRDGRILYVIHEQ